MPAEHQIFIDSNIWLYAFIESDRGKTKKAQEVIKHEHIIVSSQIVNEVCYNLAKKARFTEEETRALVLSFYRNYTVTDIGYQTLHAASLLRERYHLSFWDGLVVASAFLSGASTLYSEDMQDGLVIERRLTIRNPF